MKSISAPTIIFAIFLLIRVHVIICTPSHNPKDFDEFLCRVEKTIDQSSFDVLPFFVQDHLIEKLKATTARFKKLCVDYDNESKFESGEYRPMSSLDKSISMIFYEYKLSADAMKYKLNAIKSVDPIGFLVFLAKNNIDAKSPNFQESVIAFAKELYDKFPLGINDYYSEDYDKFLNRLQKIIDKSSVDVLPFIVKDHVIEILKETTEKFQQFCVVFENESKSETGLYSPISSLSKAVSLIFFLFKKRNPSKESKRILNEVESVDPIGFLSYLSRKNESDSSPTFMKSLEEFRMTEYKKMPIVAESIYSLRDFLDFTQRFKEITYGPESSNTLPFLLKIRVIANLWKTCGEFKLLCVQNVFKKVSPVSALTRTISSIFDQYKQSMKGSEKILNEIESVDPIGFNVYLTQKNVTVLTPNFLRNVKEFHKTMNDRVRLMKSATDDSYIEPFFFEQKTELQKIPENIREEITSEYKPLNHATIDFFIEIVMEQLKDIKMFPVTNYHNIDKYQPHNSSKTNDVQILYDGEIDSEEPGHALCIHYKASTQKVLIYNSVRYDGLSPTQHKIVDKLYPYNTGIVFRRPKTRQGKAENCAVYAITYATALLLGMDPAKHAFKSNDVFGEDGVYMRLHILEMFANRKLFLM